MEATYHRQMGQGLLRYITWGWLFWVVQHEAAVDLFIWGLLVDAERPTMNQDN
jgi:hypothetical protein